MVRNLVAKISHGVLGRISELFVICTCSAMSSTSSSASAVVSSIHVRGSVNCDCLPRASPAALYIAFSSRRRLRRRRPRLRLSAERMDWAGEARERYCPQDLAKMAKKIKVSIGQFTPVFMISCHFPYYKVVKVAARCVHGRVLFSARSESTLLTVGTWAAVAFAVTWVLSSC